MEKKLGLDPIDSNEAPWHCIGTRRAEALIAVGHSSPEAQATLMRSMGHTPIMTSDRYVRLSAEQIDG